MCLPISRGTDPAADRALKTEPITLLLAMAVPAGLIHPSTVSAKPHLESL